MTAGWKAAIRPLRARANGRWLRDDDPPAASEGLTFTLNSDGESYTVSCGTCTDTDVVIPAVYDGKPVTSIGGYAFYNCTALTKVTFGAGSRLETIHYNAFQGCSSLTSVTLPASVTSIGDCAFFSCPSLASATYGGTKAQWATIIKGVDAFSDTVTEITCSDGT
ncbi:MAG: leucine-rich repeat domain-containing protein, partial [Oscillospiraceae bacterium]|nr:leucine-rich repeat domain-containing protein [Oscillospiraceae bacterium]